MASCASIDIEDATQHLRDILKLDRPAAGERGEQVWAHGQQAKGLRGFEPPFQAANSYRPSLYPRGW